MVRMFVSAAQTVHRGEPLRLCIQQQTDSGIVANWDATLKLSKRVGEGGPIDGPLRTDRTK